MVASAVSPEQWGLRNASREFLIEKGLSPSYFDRHFCAISITYEYDTVVRRSGGLEQLTGYGYAWVTYKATFDPYLTWWQHRFPVVVGADKRPLLKDGVAVVDTSGTVALLPEFQIAEIRSLLPPVDVRNRMRALIGDFAGPLGVQMGPLDIPSDTGNAKVRLYVSAFDKNPNADSCANAERFTAIDVETGESVVRFSGACR
jgi:hypothetical protein